MSNVIALFGIVSLLTFVSIHVVDLEQNRSFTIDYNSNQFLKDGEPFQIIAGAIHYFTIHPDYWEDRLLRIRASGLNAIQAYVAWNLHEQEPGIYTFSGMANLTRFLSLANQLGLLVVLRPGPYIDNAWDMGALPWWLLKSHGIGLRTSDPRYLNAVERWWNVFLPQIIQPQLYANGGPIITIQVENEYGSYYACDRNYMVFLRDLLRKHLGPDAVLFTTDGGEPGYFPCGLIPDVLPTVDFAPAASRNETEHHFQVLRQYLPKGPLMNSEFYTAPDLDNWGHPHRCVLPSSVFIPGLIYLWDFNASVSIYSVAGGTFFGYWSGSFGDGRTDFNTMTTSFEFGALVTEAGNYDEKFYSTRRLIEIRTGIPNPYPIPPVPDYANYGSVTMKRLGSVLDLLEQFKLGATIVSSKYPITTEDSNFPFGFVVYETVLKQSGTALKIPADALHDRGYVFLDDDLMKVVQRPANTTQVAGMFAAGKKLLIMVENQGRICYGTFNNDTKGLTQNVTLDGNILTDWAIYPLKLDTIFNMLTSPITKRNLLKKSMKSQFSSLLQNSGTIAFLPSIYYGSFPAQPVLDTFLDTTGWGKGQALINGVNLGRYWASRGPQMTLYVPKPVLQEHTVLVIFELDSVATCDVTRKKCKVTFRDKPIWK